MAELTAPWRSRPRLPESPLGRNVIHRQAAPVAKGGERRGERGQEGEGRGSSQSGAVHRVALPSSRNRRHHSMRGRLLGSAGLRSTRRAQSVHSSLGERGLTTPSMHRQAPHRRACGVPGQSVVRRRREEKEGGALVVLQGGGRCGVSGPRRSRTSVRLSHTYVGSQRLSVDSTVREPGRTSNVSNTVNGRPGTSACTLLRTVHELSALCTELVLSHAPFRAHYAGPDATPKTGLGQAAPGKAVLPALPRCFVRADTP